MGEGEHNEKQETGTPKEDSNAKEESNAKEVSSAKESSNEIGRIKPVAASSAPKSEPKKKSETVENIVALSVFFLIVIIVAALFTNGFGLFAKSTVDKSQRFTVDIGNSAVKGKADHPVVIVAFSDFECPYCKDAEGKMDDIMKKYDGKAVFVFKNFPLSAIHPDAYGAALAGECAKEQDKFWEFHDMVFAHNDQIGSTYLEAYAKALGLNTDQFNKCLEEKKYSYQVEQDIQQGKDLGVSSTPTFFINGIRVVGDLDETEYIKIIDSELKTKI